MDELELRRRVFWTTYAIEITVAFNLGRPASISFQDADAPFPRNSEETALSIHHIKHRQIQEQMLCLVYRSRPHNAVAMSELDNSMSNIESLQQGLDEWHGELHELYRQSSSPYPVEYWDLLYYSTSAALSRPTTLFPRPGPELQTRCFLSSYRVIEIHETLIRKFRLPYSWMLLQGLVFSAISMIVTTRTSTTVLAKEFGADGFLDILTRGVRNFHVVLAVMRERWTGLAIRHLEELLDKLCQDTLRYTINVLAKQSSARASSVQSSVHPGLLSGNPSSQELQLAFQMTNVLRMKNNFLAVCWARGRIKKRMFNSSQLSTRGFQNCILGRTGGLLIPCSNWTNSGLSLIFSQSSHTGYDGCRRATANRTKFQLRHGGGLHFLLHG